MANYTKRISDTMVRLGEVRFSYCHLFEPKANPNGKLKYSVAILIPKKDKATLEVAQAAINAAMEAGKASKWGGRIPAKCASPLRDGDEERPDDPNYEGMMFINASSDRKPGVCVLEGGKVVEALDEEDVYSGCWGAIVINFFPYDNSGNRGVGAGMNNVIKTRDDERLAGGSSAETDFADMES